MFEKEAKVKEPKYISCIKINGVPILPPLITHAKRKEILKNKQQAVKLEKRLRRERELKDYINKYYTPKFESCTNMFTSTLEHRLSFNNLVFPVNDNGNVTTNSVKDEVPFASKKKTSKLSCDLQVSQYANNEFTVLTSFEKAKSNIVVIDEPASCIIDSFKYTNNGLENAVEESEIAQKPRLIRSNSYVLETPSPMLLEHLRRHNESVDENMPLSKASGIGYTQEPNIFSTDLQAIRASQDCDCIYIDDSSNRDVLSVSRTESELKNISTFSDQISDNGDLTIIESQHHLKEFIDNNLPQMVGNDLFLENEESDAKQKLQHTSKNENNNYFDSSLENIHNSKISLTDHLTNCDNQSLMKILHNIPDMYSKQIIELLEKHKQEQLIKVKNQDQYFCNYNTKIETDHKTYNCLSQKVQTINSHPNLEQNIRNRITMPQDTSISVYSTSKYGETIKSPENIVIFGDNQLCNKTVPNCSCELFSNFSRKTKTFTEDYAASIIVAAAKGYLVRRLMRTDRIQGLIQTIKDALVCAMQLHSESTETINESDVELHRRLIQQVSATCFEFHDVFFSLSASERMTIIRLDRERQKDKLKRPLSRASSIGKSSRSSRSFF